MLKSINVIEEILATIPEIKSLYEKEIEWWNGEQPGLHNIFGNVLNPFLIAHLEAEENIDLIQRIFAFLEKMSRSTDDDIDNVLVVTILARLGDDTDVLKKSIKYMGANTLEKSYRFEKHLGRTLKPFGKRLYDK